MTDLLLNANINFVALVLFGVFSGLLFYAYLGYPVLLALVARFFRIARPEPGYTPTISLIISAYNEEASIARKLEETLRLEYPADKLEIIVASDGSTDNTDAIVRRCADPRVILLPIHDRRGKTNAQNQAVKIAKGEVLVFSDATATYHPKALLYLAAHYQDLGIGAVSGRYQYFDPSASSPTGIGSMAFWNYENLIKLFQSRIYSLTGCSGCIYSVRKAVYEPLPLEACSDLVEPLCIVRKGYRVAFEDRALAYEETTQTSSDEFGMRVRVATRGIRGVLSTRDLLNPFQRPWIAFQLLSHKVMRWSVPVFLIGLFLSNMALLDSPLFRFLWFLQLAFYAFSLLGLLFRFQGRWRALAIPSYFCTLNGAVLVGILKVLRGGNFVIWQTVRK